MTSLYILLGFFGEVSPWISIPRAAGTWTNI